MAGILVGKCPHCDADRIAFEVAGRSKSRDPLAIAYLQCPSCTLPAVALLAAHTNHDSKVGAFMSGRGHDVERDLGFDTVRIIPAPEAPKAPDHVPAAVARVFVQARDSQRRQQFDTAAMAYRKALDVALKLYEPEIGGMMNQRINALADKHALTPALKDWAHHVRLIGNEGAHEPEEPTKQDVDDLEAFTESVLEYLFTLPERIRIRRARTEGEPS